jgi:hypothetical protein
MIRTGCRVAAGEIEFMKPSAPAEPPNMPERPWNQLLLLVAGVSCDSRLWPILLNCEIRPSDAPPSECRARR